MIKMVVNLGSNTVDNNDKSSPQIYHLPCSLLMIIVDTSERGYLVDMGNYLKRKYVNLR